MFIQNQMNRENFLQNHVYSPSLLISYILFPNTLTFRAEISIAVIILGSM